MTEHVRGGPRVLRPSQNVDEDSIFSLRVKAKICRKDPPLAIKTHGVLSEETVDYNDPPRDVTRMMVRGNYPTMTLPQAGELLE